MRIHTLTKGYSLPIIENDYLYQQVDMTANTTLLDEWMDQLQQSGYRRTPARTAIVAIILSTSRALEPIEIFEQGRRQQSHLGLVTVYRTLEKLEELGLIQRVHQPGGCNMYLPAAFGHQHLIICTGCGNAEFFAGDDLSPLMERIASQSGYTISDHWLQMYGLCKNCQSIQN